jgi:hypothetical protein
MTDDFLPDVTTSRDGKELLDDELFEEIKNRELDVRVR